MSHRNILAVILFAAAAAARADEPEAIQNPAIDMQAHLRYSAEAARHRETRRVTEDEFIRMSREPGTVVLDARSKAMFDLLHVKGAMNLSFPDIAVATLAAAIPDKGTRILIYCNNNFKSAVAFPTKIAPASLNLSTYATLYMYGYGNVYELGPILDAKTCRLELESTK